MKRRVSAVALGFAALAVMGVGLVAAAPAPAGIFGPNSNPYGRSYGEWSAEWWQWAMELPVEGHPFLDTPAFEVTSGQTGDVWFLGAPFGTVERTCTIPAGKSLFVGLLNAEMSSLEGVPTEEEQRAVANFLADHILDVSCTLDGAPVSNIDDFRFESPQFDFSAPSPWIFGETGGDGTAVADGYYVFMKPLRPGEHVLHFSGSFHFSIKEGDPFDFDATIDMTYYLTQLGPGEIDDDDDDQ